MAERIPDILDKYDFEVKSTKKGRGVIIVDTSKGLKTIKEFLGSGRYIEATANIMNMLNDTGLFLVDSYVKNLDGEYITISPDSSRYVIKDWYECEECDVKRYNDVIALVDNLAILHNELGKANVSDYKYAAKSALDDMKKHNVELVKVKKYLKKQNNRNRFEAMALEYYDEFEKEGINAVEMYMNYVDEPSIQKGLCHGCFDYHNVYWRHDLPVVTNFEKMHFDYYVRDLYHLMRKIMEKYDWDIKLGYEIISRYDKIKRLSSRDIEYLAVLFSYPEKFWKIVNTYFNTRKTWLSAKNCEKLKRIVAQNRKRMDFINTII